ncbi:transcriptional adapter 2-alpha-like [Babylonia areolata]|uniref:transcriptional adapter 2-alpha-like n=1 Tax=Babylonia areolata TaxID=304850 RepID=UPI003FD59FE4
MESREEESEECAVCTCELAPPFIHCRQCPGSVKICLPCFAKGGEVGLHQNDHAYSVVKNDFPLFENHWTAAEELALLNAMETHGYGNWTDISLQQSVKPAEECERHYNKCYISNPQSSLPKFPEYEPDIVPTPILFKLSDNPPRPPEGSPLCTEMGGYSAPRGEFAIEYNNFAEMDICNLTFDDQKQEEEDEEDVELMNDMKLAMIHIYHRKLRERHRRKRIVKDFGLINLRNVMWFQHMRLDREVSQTVKNLEVFTSLMTPLHNNMLQEALAYEQELKSRICELQEFRRNGLKHQHSISLYKLLRARRTTSRQRRHLLTDVICHIRDDAICQSWLQRQGVTDDSCKIIPLPSVPRKQAAPLRIEGMPGYERLLPLERELCEKHRVAPEAFLEYSAILISEGRKHGGLRLAQARTLIKIDVNKTRKIYDYLVQEGKILKL